MVDSIATLLEAAAAYLVGLLEDAHSCMKHAKRGTIMSKDVQLVRCIHEQISLKKDHFEKHP